MKNKVEDDSFLSLLLSRLPSYLIVIGLIVVNLFLMKYVVSIGLVLSILVVIILMTVELTLVNKSFKWSDMFYSRFVVSKIKK